MTGCQRCGDCCRYFRMDYGPVALQKLNIGPACDAPVIKAMVVPVHQERFPSGRFGTGWRYRCKHLVENGSISCAIYETRPEMCRRYLCTRARGIVTELTAEEDYYRVKGTSPATPQADCRTPSPPAPED